MMDDLIIIIKSARWGLKPIRKSSGSGYRYHRGVFSYNSPIIGSKLIVPFAGGLEWDLGGWYVPFTAFVMVSMVNSVNLIDGLDGLASGVTMINSAAYTVILLGMYQLYVTTGLDLAAAGMLTLWCSRR